jgi:hypothetical protein
MLEKLKWWIQKKGGETAESKGLEVYVPSGEWQLHCAESQIQKKEKGADQIHEETMTKSFPNSMKDI